MQSDPVGWLCVHWEVRSTTNFVGVGLGRVDGQVKEWVWAARGLFGDEIAVFVEQCMKSCSHVVSRCWLWMGLRRVIRVSIVFLL